MNRHRRHIVSRAISGMAGLVLATTPFRHVLASGAIAGATEPTQILNNIELVLQYEKQIQQYATQLMQWKDQLQNVMNIPNQIWSSIQNDLMGVMNVVKQGQALAFSLANIGEQFQLKFPGFKTTANYTADYKNWSQTLRDTIKGTLEAANLQSQQFATEEGVINQLRMMSSSNQGRMQAIQTGNQIAVEVVAQMQKLRALSLAQMQAQNAYMAKNEQEKDTTKAAVESLLNRNDIRDGKNYKGY